MNDEESEKRLRELAESICGHDNWDRTLRALHAAAAIGAAEAYEDVARLFDSRATALADAGLDRFIEMHNAALIRAHAKRGGV